MTFAKSLQLQRGYVWVGYRSDPAGDKFDREFLLFNHLKNNQIN